MSSLPACTFGGVVAEADGVRVTRAAMAEVENIIERTTEQNRIPKARRFVTRGYLFEQRAVFQHRVPAVGVLREDLPHDKPGIGSQR